MIHLKDLPRTWRKTGRISRREFIKRSGLILAGSVGASSLPLTMALRRGLPQSAFIEPLTHEEQTMAAFADTIVPGRSTDPDGAPGALEAGALNLIYDPYYPLAEMVPVLVVLLDGQAQRIGDGDFISLDLEGRTQALMEATADLSLLELAIAAVQATFYSAIFNEVGTEYIGFPGPSRGHIDFSFGVKLAQEMTDTGELP